MLAQVFVMLHILIRMDPHHFGKLDLNQHKSENGVMEGCGRSQVTTEAWRFKMKPWRVCKAVVADPHHLDA
jgi:hypothetical protein